MKKEKKTISNRPWFAPLIVTISIIMFMVLAAFQLGPSSGCIIDCSASLPKSYGKTLAFEAYLGVPVIILVWIVFAICYAIKESTPERKKYRSANTKEVSAYGEYVPKTKKKMSFDKFSVIFSVIINLVSILLILIIMISSNKRANISGSVMGGDEMLSGIGYAMTMPVRIVSIILSLISISNNKTKFKSINKMPEEIRKLTTRNIISMIILIILTIVPFLYVFLPMLGLRLKFAGI